MTGPVLIVAAHPDDEALGCGGTMARWSQEGRDVHVAFLADGVFSRNADALVLKQELDTRRAAANQACMLLGARSVTFGDFPDNRLDTVPMLDLAKAVEALVSRYQPSTIVTHHPGDLNVDHGCVQRAIATACRPQKGHPVREILCFEVPSSTEWQLGGNSSSFVPNVFIDISKFLSVKLAALEAYAMEMRDWPHPRSKEGVEHLARWRGAIVGVDAAEAFVLSRRIN